MKPIIKHRAEALARYMLPNVKRIEYGPDTLTAETWGRHDEGWTREGVTITPRPDGSFLVSGGADGSDCDGRLSTSDLAVVRPLKRSKRYYMGFPTRGRFGVKRYSFNVRESSRRDYSAEAAGY